MGFYVLLLHVLLQGYSFTFTDYYGSTYIHTCTPPRYMYVCTRCSPVCTPGLHILLLKNNFSIIKALRMCSWQKLHGKNYNYYPNLFHVFLVLSFTQCQRTIQNHVFFRTVGIHHIITHSFHLKRRKRFVCVFKHTAVKHMGGQVQ